MNRSARVKCKTLSGPTNRMLRYIKPYLYLFKTIPFYHPHLTIYMFVCVSQVRVESLSRQWSGSLQIGLTTMAISDSTPVSLLPQSACELTSKVTWVISGSEVKKNGVTVKENYTPSLDRLEVGEWFMERDSYREEIFVSQSVGEKPFMSVVFTYLLNAL